MSVWVQLLAMLIVLRPAQAEQGSLLPSNAPSNQVADQGQSTCVNLSTRTTGEDWPHFLGPRWDGTSVETGILTDWSKGKLKVVWSHRLGTSYGIGSVALGRYLQLDRVGDFETLICLHAETGKLLWTSQQPVQYEDMYNYNNGPRSSPTVDDDAVYTMGVSGQLTCRNLSDGAIRWTVDTSAQFGVIQNFFGVGGSPLVVGNYVIAMVGGSPKEDQDLPPGQLDRVSPNGSGLVAFDKKTGAVAYKVGDYLASYSTPRPVVVDGQEVVIAFVREGLAAIDPETGKELWLVPWRSRKLESVNASVPVVFQSQVLVSECYEVGSLLLELGLQQPKVLRSDERNRREKSFRAHWATPIRVDNFLYGCSGRNSPDSDLRCIEWDTGNVRWIDPRRERSSLLSIDGHMIVLGEYGELELIQANPDKYQSVTSVNLAELDPNWPNRPRLTYPCWAAPIVSHGLMYVRGDNAVVCFELIPPPQ